MKRKLFSSFWAVVVCIIVAISFTACDGSSDTDNGDNAQETRTDYISLDKTSITLEPGETATVTATVSEDFAGKSVIWKSLDESIATVDNGKITAVKPGGATIMVIAGIETAWCRVTVSWAITLKDLRCDPTYYLQTSVCVKGIITAQFNNSVFIEEYDEETGLYFGMEVYYGFQTGPILQQLEIGNKIRVAGALTEFKGAFQIAGISYNQYKPDLPTNTVVISKGHEGAFVETGAKDIVSGKIDVKHYDETISLDYGDAVTATTVTVSDLKVLRTYTINDYYGDYGAMMLECLSEDGTVICVNTGILKDSDGNVITADKYEGKTITVRGIVEKYFNEQNASSYGVRCHLADYITIL